MVILVQQQLGALLHVLKVKWEMAFAMISTTKLNVNSIKVRSLLITIREITSLLLWKGDCCGPDVVKGSCYSCICHEDSPLDPSCEPSFIGDGYCDDFNNVPGCAYDEGIAFTHRIFIPILIFLPHFRRLLFTRSQNWLLWPMLVPWRCHSRECHRKPRDHYNSTEPWHHHYTVRFWNNCQSPM